MGLSLTSCGGSDRVAVYPVRGQVLWKGKPLCEAMVFFEPVENAAGNLLPAGRVGADGFFTLATYESGDGAPAGEYVVTLTWTDDEDVPEEFLSVRGSIETLYSDIQKSTLRATIAAGQNDLKPFLLGNEARPSGAER